MLKPEMVPKEAVEAARKIIRLPDEWIDDLIAAALNAWPGAFLYPLNKTRLILPITENPDDKV